MAQTILQNSQRLNIFMAFATILAATFFITLRLVKKKVDVTKP